MSEGAPLFEQPLPVLSLHRRRWKLGAPLVGVGAICVAALLYAGWGPGLIGYLLIALGAMAMGTRQRPRTVQIQKVSAGPEGLSIDGRLALRSEEIATGFFEPENDGHAAVRLIGKNGDSLFEARVASKAMALSLLRALGVDAEHRRVELSALSPIVSKASSGGLLVAMLMAALLAALGGHTTAVAYVLPVLVSLVALAAIPTRVVVGLDGVFTQWLFRRRFVPAGEIVSAEPNLAAGIHLTLRSGEQMILATPATAQLVARRDRDAMLGRIREVIAVHRSREEAGDLRAALARDGRSATEWAAALRTVKGTGGDYRSASIRSDDLLRIVEDPAASEDARAGAAFALRHGADPEGDGAHERIRVAAEATASPRLRVALESATGDDVDAARALEAFDDGDSSGNASVRRASVATR